MEEWEKTQDRRCNPGRSAIAGALIAVLGVLAAAHPQNVVLRALYNAAPHLAEALPMLITAFGGIMAAFSEPPSLTRDDSR